MSGGVSGEVGYAAYVEAMHKWILWGDYTDDSGNLADTDGIEVLVNAYKNLSPYDGETAYDPDTALAASQARFDTFDSIVTGLDEDADWATFIDTAVAKAAEAGTFPDVDTDIGTIASNAITRASSVADSAAAAADAAVDSDVVDNMVDAYEGSIDSPYARTINRFAGGMAEINAVNSSAFIVGLSLIENDRQKDVNRYRRELELNIYNSALDVYSRAFQGVFAGHAAVYGARERSRDLFLIQAASDMGRMLTAKVDAHRLATASLAELNRIKIVAKQEEAEQNLAIDVGDAKWPFEVYMYAANALGVITGAAAMRKMELSRTQSALGGVFSGAGLGARVGTAIEPGLGTAIGAGIGAAVGGAAGYFL